MLVHGIALHDAETTCFSQACTLPGMHAPHLEHSPGACTPSRYEPNVKMVAFASCAMLSDKPKCRATPLTHSFTIWSMSPSTSSRSSASSVFSYRPWLCRYCSQDREDVVSAMEQRKEREGKESAFFWRCSVQ